MRQLVLLSILIFIGCQSEPKKEVSIPETQTENRSVSAADIAKLQYTEFVLGPDGAEAVLDWPKYQELLQHITLLKTADFSFFEVKNEDMATFISGLKDEQPESVKTPAIRSRLTVLETNLLRLRSLVNRRNLEKNELLEALEELFIADANLKLQINKKFEKQTQQIQLPVTNE